jgi:predicted anti-sigma-YlaC factor YlaD
MQCLQVENILIERLTEQSAAIPAQVRAHLEYCPQCRRLAEDLQKLRRETASLAAISVPEAMADSVLQRCRSKLRSGIQPFPARVPVWVRACAGLLLVLTILWAYTVLEDFVTEESINYSTGLVIALFVQNTIMLLFAPLVIRIFRDRAQKPQDWFMHALRRH